MHDDFAQQVYDTLCGNLIESAQVPGVEDLFADGTVCSEAYCHMLAAKERLAERLQQQNEDPDIEIIVDELLKICHTVGLKMFEYGSRSTIKHPAKTDTL